MLTILQQVLAGMQSKERKGRRRLRVEPLESRIVLSAASPAASVFHAVPPAVDALSSLVDTDFTARLTESTHEFQPETVAERDNVHEQVEFFKPNAGRLSGIERRNATAQITTSSLTVDHAFPRSLSAGDDPDQVASFPDVSDHRFPSSFAPPGGSDLVQRRADREASSFFDRAPDPFANTHALDVFALRNNRGSEGGFVTIKSIRPELDLRAVDHILAMRKPFLGASPLMRLGRFSALESTWLDASEGGFVTLAAQEAIVSTNSNVDLAGRMGAGLTATVPSFENVAHDTPPALIGPLDGTRSSSWDGETEGGFVDIDVEHEASSLWLERTDHTPTVTLPWDSEGLDSVDSIWSALGDEIEPLERNHVGRGDDRQVSEHAVGESDSEDVAQDSRWAFHSEEGGMIELAAAVLSAESSDALEASLGATGEEPSTAHEAIRMDKGIGLFQAFELATVPTEHVDGSQVSSFEASEVDPPADVTASRSPDDGPAAEHSAACNGESTEQLVQSAAAIPTIVVVASLMSSVDCSAPTGLGMNVHRTTSGPLEGSRKASDRRAVAGKRSSANG